MTRVRALLRSTFPLAVPLLALALRGADAAAGEACTTVTAEKLGVEGLVIEGSAMQDAKDGLPRHCLLRARVDDRTGADGKPYAIRFEMRLPVEWNGRFLHQGNGGADGEVKPAIGDISGTLASGGLPALRRRRVAAFPAGLERPRQSFPDAAHPRAQADPGKPAAPAVAGRA